ncbi:hypothetical protein [Phytohabitans houttuyneae]|uniref:MacB-like periplasmic core domain-containing protein n=1 Tax=Phytohabitans houttuyneae TaxID=1076126 RepID=A0A6V8KB79_9ACTN|nr:hypothetical protein [Phytohabitans houttuyneae]GFJ79648.1 hypothetical protein Phou_038280 [Phytohabitans houttuyneae]
MIRFGLRLALATGREAIVRLAIISAAVALGVGLLLTALAGINAVGAQNQRYAWLNSGLVGETAGPKAANPSWWVLRDDYFAAQRIARLDIAATGPDSPVPPGIPRLPAPGSTTCRPHSATCCGHTRRPSWPIDTRAAASARSATARCPRPTRC